jgi:hypothetical protein
MNPFIDYNVDRLGSAQHHPDRPVYLPLSYVIDGSVMSIVSSIDRSAGESLHRPARLDARAGGGAASA